MKVVKDLPDNPTPEQIKEISENVKVQEAAKEVAQDLIEDSKKTDDFNDFITFTKDKFDKHFSHLGYTCFVFDKEEAKNKFMSVISNTVPGYYLGKLIPFVTKHRETLRDIKRKLDKKLSRVQ